ncbi:MAG: YjbQ family protein [Anaerolineales bacterium]|nr:YjbQ family protein [Anaerolineales bacterium]
MTYIKKISLKTTEIQEWVNLLGEVKEFVAESGVQEGLCLVYNPHTTAGLFINSYLDPNTPEDIMFEWNRLVPTRFDFFHQFDTPTDAAGHVKSVLMGSTVSLIIHEGGLVVGHSQGIVFAEFDGPRERHVFVKIIEG